MFKSNGLARAIFEFYLLIFMTLLIFAGALLVVKLWIWVLG